VRTWYQLLSAANALWYLFDWWRFDRPWPTKSTSHPVDPWGQDSFSSPLTQLISIATWLRRSPSLTIYLDCLVTFLQSLTSRSWPSVLGQQYMLRGLGRYDATDARVLLNIRRKAPWNHFWSKPSAVVLRHARSFCSQPIILTAVDCLEFGDKISSLSSPIYYTFKIPTLRFSWVIQTLEYHRFSATDWLENTNYKLYP